MCLRSLLFDEILSFGDGWGWWSGQYGANGSLAGLAKAARVENGERASSGFCELTWGLKCISWGGPTIQGIINNRNRVSRHCEMVLTLSNNDTPRYGMALKIYLNADGLVKPTGMDHCALVGRL